MGSIEPPLTSGRTRKRCIAITKNITTDAVFELEMQKNAFVAGALPWKHWGSLQHSPKNSAGLVKDWGLIHTHSNQWLIQRHCHKIYLMIRLRTIAKAKFMIFWDDYTTCLKWIRRTCLKWSQDLSPLRCVVSVLQIRSSSSNEHLKIVLRSSVNRALGSPEVESKTLGYEPAELSLSLSINYYDYCN